MRNSLRRVVDHQFVAVPQDRRRMRFYRVMVLKGRTVYGVDRCRRRRHRRFGIADVALERLTHRQPLGGAVRLGFVECGDRRFRLVGRADQRGGMIRLLLTVGQHQRDRLAVPVDSVVLHDRKIVAAAGSGVGLVRAHHHGHGLHHRCVPMRHNQDDARDRFRLARVKCRDAALRDRAEGERGIGHVVEHELGRERRRAPHLEGAIDTRHGSPDQALPVLDQRVGRAARQPAVGCHLDGLAHQPLNGLLDGCLSRIENDHASPPVSSLATQGRQLPFAIGTAMTGAMSSPPQRRGVPRLPTRSQHWLPSWMSRARRT